MSAPAALFGALDYLDAIRCAFSLTIATAAISKRAFVLNLFGLIPDIPPQAGRIKTPRRSMHPADFFYMKSFDSVQPPRS